MVSATQQRPAWIGHFPFYYGWINVIVASVAMTATLPGRTHGLGLITEPLLRDLAIDRTLFAQINFASALLGALACLPIGWLIDRHGARVVLTGVVAALGLSVIGMSHVVGPVWLFFALLAVRGLGQSALSVVSMAAIGKWFGRRAALAMGLFAVLLTFGFIVSVLMMGLMIEDFGWRGAWRDLGWALLAFAPVCWLIARSTPESCGVTPDAPAAPDNTSGADDFMLGQALRTPAFWIVVAGTSAFNLAWSAITLFNESMLSARGFDQKAAVQVMSILTGVGLLANLASAKWAKRASVIKLLGVALVMLAGALALFTRVGSFGALCVYAAAMGLSGGVVTVVFFAAWGQLFGRARLGGIQGAAQSFTVLASALGPVLMAECQARFGSYDPLLLSLAAVVIVLALVAWLTPLPTVGARS